VWPLYDPDTMLLYTIKTTVITVMIGHCSIIAGYNYILLMIQSSYKCGYWLVHDTTEGVTIIIAEPLFTKNYSGTSLYKKPSKLRTQYLRNLHNKEKNLVPTGVTNTFLTSERRKPGKKWLKYLV